MIYVSYTKKALKKLGLNTTIESTKRNAQWP